MFSLTNDRADRDLQYTTHQLISFAICRNVPGHTDPICEINPDCRVLAARFLEILEKLHLPEDERGYVVKKANQYLSICSPFSSSSTS